MLAPVLGDDPVFGHMNNIGLEAFFEEAELGRARQKVASWQQGVLLVVGVGASIVSPQPDVLIYADLARWRYKAGSAEMRSQTWAQTISRKVRV